ncbi:GNAT family N-acetyltransferase [Vallitalea okinawensis]|uniref:GNAT family N-acetyltransferase n=1 Tax=Vallitalea okinawensis TaxID=2078660 RepID=UPI001478EFBB|nr:GNAT family N-acetyltransferase [Vallitalea okinawensis]
MDFEYKNYKLRKATKEDANGFVEISNDWNVMRYYGDSGATKDLIQAEKQVEWCNELFNNNCGRWIIVDKEINEYIGDIGFFDYETAHRKVEIGFRLMKEFWGRGIVSSFIQQLLNYGFKELNYNRVQAYVDARNEGSKRVLLKNGFTCEGILREFEYEYGGFIDLEMYSILDREFKNE